ncbi:YheT family hydrolase [Pseudohongiella spirulinae]|uniref:Alpha/beta hydrolase n=1 Tax=Pseudohongiella spirulinae TaxID=1249552 RepID=A0A0S2KHJ6_9GAMM|nr:alpha/beta fold hydrolase [Pseudohongiella spirulinae]ALO47582.1 alpha/beta hydrolase [Pseudohongiella spirulinae]
MNRAEVLGAPYQSPWWLPDGHTQTVWRKFSRQPTLQRRRQRIELADGDFIDVDLAEPLQLAGDTGRPWVLLVHGLAGCSSSPYVLAMQAYLQQQGLPSAAMNLRGCSGEPNRLALAYHSGCSDDVEQVVATLMTLEMSDRPLIVIGYSLGANVLLKWASHTRYQQSLQAVISVSNPFSLALCSQQMSAGVTAWYGRYFLRRLRNDLLAKREYLVKLGHEREVSQIDALGPLQSLRTLWEFDDRVTAPLHGFSNAADYYQRCSSRQFINKINVPVLMVHGLNDPIIPPSALPMPDELPATVIRDVHRTGGHVGFARPGEPRWLEQRIWRFIELTQSRHWCSVGGN